MTGHLILLVVGCVLLASAVILHIICLSTPYYAMGDDLGNSLTNASDLSSYISFYPDMDASYGFWKICFKIYSTTMCYSFGLSEDINSSTVKAPDWMIACQALSLIGLIFGALGVVMPLIWLCVKFIGLLALGSFSAIIGGITIIVANIVFAAKMSMKFIFISEKVFDFFGEPKENYILATDDSFDYGWGFGLDIATGIVCILIGILFGACAAMVKSGRLYITKKESM